MRCDRSPLVWGSKLSQHHRWSDTRVEVPPSRISGEVLPEAARLLADLFLNQAWPGFFS
jgi:hypothetical protein